MAIPSLLSYPMPLPASFPTSKVSWSVQPNRSVLLIHDMQEYFVSFYGAGSPLVTQLVANIAALRDWCRVHGVPVVYTAQPVDQEPADRALLNDMWGPGLTAADPQLQRVVPALQPQASDTLLVKWRYSAFQRSSLEQMMGTWGRDQLLICGVYAHIGCMTTALDGFMRDIQPFFIGDALADFSEAEHRMALQYVAGRCGRIVDCASVLAVRPALSYEGLQARLLTLIDEPAANFDADENLMDYGLDSVQVMELVAEFKQQGIALEFEDLARWPSLNGWWALIQQRRAA